MNEGVNEAGKYFTRVSGEVFVPFTCSRCGAHKRNDEGQLVYAPAHVVRRHQPQVCPACFEALTLAHALGKLVLWEEDEDSER